MSNMLNLEGQRFGMMQVLERCGGTKWRCLCDCGIYKIVTTTNLRSGDVRSCGCKQGLKSEYDPNMQVCVEYQGRKITLRQLAEETGIKYMTLYMRLRRGWSVERAIGVATISPKVRGTMTYRCSPPLAQRVGRDTVRVSEREGISLEKKR